MKRTAKRNGKRRAMPARAKLARKSANAKPPSGKRKNPKSSRDKVRAHRTRLRGRGMRPITIWVPDIRSPEFAAEARRQCRLANKSAYAAQDQTWVDSMVDWSAA